MNGKNYIGKIVKTSDTRYRIIHYANENYVFCQLDVSQLNLFYYPEITLQQDIQNHCVEIEENREVMVMDIDSLSSNQKAAFQQRKDIVMAIVAAYGPSFMNLMGKGAKPELRDICKKFEVAQCTLWKYIRTYLQSGFNDCSLLDRRMANLSPRTHEYRYQRKTGRPQDNIITGVVRTDTVIFQFEKALERYKARRTMTFKHAYLWLLQTFYKKEVLESSDQDLIRPISEIPTYQQFLYYCNKQLSEKEKRIIKTSITEERNDHRLLSGTSGTNALRPGWIIEVDALEIDCSIVSQYDPSQCVGRPILYMMIDCYSRAIVAFSLSFENNSVLGLTNLLLNLVEDKKDFCRRYDYVLDNATDWPSNFIPHELRCDRGADFKSDQFSTICQRLGINRTLVSGGSGSLKGLIEKSFRDFHTEIRPDLEEKGLITKRHDSKHHQQAIFDQIDMNKLVISFIMYHNLKSMPEYPMKKNMIKKLDMPPSPIWLWEDGCRQFGLPTIIKPGQKDQFIFDLMLEETAKLSRRGISLYGLYYHIPDDEKLLKQVYALSKSTTTISVRVDPRYMGAVYYQSDYKLYRAPLNLELSGDAEYANMTLQQLKDHHHELKKLKKNGDAHNTLLRVEHHNINQQIIGSKKKSNSTDTSNMRAARALEKARANHQNKLEQHFEEIPQNDLDTHSQLPAEKRKAPISEPPKNIFEALQKFKELEEEDFDDL